MIREYVRSLIENLGNEIRLLVYGGNGSTGLLMKVNQLTAFSEKFILDGNGNVIGVSGSSLVLTDSSGVLSTKFNWTDDQDVEHEVTASIGTSVYYDQTSGTYKGRLLLDGDNVAINGECISITNNGNPVAVFTNGKVTASLIDVDTLAVGVVNAINDRLTINADRIDFVTNGVSIENADHVTTFEIDTNGNVTVRGTVYANGGEFTGVTVKGNIFTPYQRITSGNQSTYIRTYTIGGTEYKEIVLAGSNSVQIEVSINGSVSLPYVSDRSMLGCELNILNLSGASLDLVGGYKDTSHITGLVARNVSTGDVVNNVALKYLCEAKFKLIDNQGKQYTGNASPYIWMLVSITER